MAKPKQGNWIVCRHEDIIDGQLYLCVRNPGHLGNHTPQRADHELVSRLAAKSTKAKNGKTGPLPRRDAAWFDPSPDAPTVTIPTVKPNSQPRPAVLSGADLMLAEVDQTADEAIRQMGDRYLLDLMVEEFDYEVAQTERLMGQLEDEVYDRVRFLDFADAANVAGHHPAAAYCYAADRFDPAVIA